MPKSNGTPASFIRASVSSSPTCRAQPSGSSPSTTSAGRASNGSRRAKARSSGRDCRAKRSPPTRCGSSFCARLQPRQFPAHAGDAGADQGLVADESEGKADQDRREGGERRPLCYLPDGRGRHRTANVPGDFAAHRGTAAAATTSASVRRSMSCIQEQPTEGVRPNAKENGQIRPLEQAFGLPEVLVAV